MKFGTGSVHRDLLGDCFLFCFVLIEITSLQIKLNQDFTVVLMYGSVSSQELCVIREV
jgi:hypothetical protein